MDLSNLSYPKGARKKAKRIGRGPGSGSGKTAGRGYNGYFSRGGSKNKYHFEGGQMPLQRRLPKFGFKNVNHVEYTIVSLSALNVFENGTHVTPLLLKEMGIINHLRNKVKILANGELNKNIKITADRFSKTAIAIIEKSGSTYEKIEEKKEA